MKGWLYPGIAALAVAAPAQAQQVTGSIRGAITAAGRPVANARITIVHLPSGTVSRLTAGRDGQFAVNGLRIGGPFSLTVEAPGYEQLRVAGIALAPGEPLRLPIRLAAQQEMLVAADGLRTVALRSGPVTRFDRAAIAGIGSAVRDLGDLVRRAPLGADDAVSVDGVRVPYGLARGPVARDAIAAVSVRATPFDVASAEPGVDLVLRSGDNDPAGSAFYAQGIGGGRGLRDFGGFLSGAVVRDRLFVAAAFERRQTDARRAQNGSVRVDWNVADGQHASLRYLHADGTGPDASLDAGALQIDSDWSDTVSTETRLTYVHREGDAVPGRDGIGGQIALRWRQGAHLLTGLAGARRDGGRGATATSYGAALQDSWNMSPVFNLTTGLRLERRAFAGDGVTAQPRVALTWQPRRRLVVRGGIGRFAGEAVGPQATIPQPPAWRSSLSVDYTLDLGPFGDGWRFGGDLLYAQDRAAVAPVVRPIGADRDPVFAAVARVGTEWDFGLAASLSYTFLDARRQAGQPVPMLRHAYRIALDYRRALIGDRLTHIGLFGQSVPGAFRIDLHLDQEIAAASRGRLILFADLENALDAAGQAEPLYALGDIAPEQAGWGARVGARAEF